MANGSLLLYLGLHQLSADCRCGCKITLLGGFNFISCYTTVFGTLETLLQLYIRLKTGCCCCYYYYYYYYYQDCYSVLHRSLLFLVQTFFSGSVYVRCNIDNYPVRSLTYCTEHVTAYDVHMAFVHSEDRGKMFSTHAHYNPKCTGCFLRKYRLFVTKHYHCQP